MPFEHSIFQPSQRYVHYIMESAQYLYQDISTMNNFFNWTMTYRWDFNYSAFIIVKYIIYAEGTLTSIVLTGGS